MDTIKIRETHLHVDLNTSTVYTLRPALWMGGFHSYPLVYFVKNNNPGQNFKLESTVQCSATQRK